MRTGYIGSSTTDPRSNHVVNLNQTKFIRASARARPTSKGDRVDHQNHDFFFYGTMVLNSKKEPLFFYAGEQEMIMNAYEEYKTIIMAKSKCDLVQWVVLSVSSCTVASSITLSSKVYFNIFLVSRLE